MQNLWSAWRIQGQSFWVGVELDLWWIEPPASEGTVGPDIQAKNGLSMFLDLNLKLKLLWSPVIQVPNELLEQAKAAAQAALEEMDAD
jgi:hypothetical protein